MDKEGCGELYAWELLGKIEFWPLFACAMELSATSKRANAAQPLHGALSHSDARTRY